MKIRQLTPSEFEALDQALNLATRVVDRALDTGSAQEFYDALIATERRSTELTIALGLAFGQLIIDASDFEWVRVKDEYGEETCIAVKDTQLICSPISMIQKRLERNESFEIASLVDGTVKLMQDKANSADYRKA